MSIIFLFPTLSEIPCSLKTLGMKSQKMYSISGDIPYQILCTGPGKTMANEIQKIHAPALLISLGYAGGLTRELKSGDIVLCSRFLCQGQETILSDSSIKKQVISLFSERKIPFYEGSSYTSEKVVSSPQEKASLASKGALVVEMENYWAAKKARELEIPFASIRIVLDSMDFFLPDMSYTLKPDGEISLPSTFYHLIRFPSHIFPMLKLYSLTKKIEPVLFQCCKTLCLVKKETV